MRALNLRIVVSLLFASAVIITAVAALSFSTRPQTLSTSSPEPAPTRAVPASRMFDVEVVYAYMGPNYIPPYEHGHFGNVQRYEGGTNYPGLVVLNYTYLGNSFEAYHEVVFEGCSFEFLSDTGLSVTCKAYVGTNLNRSDPDPELPGMLPTEEAMSVSVRLNLAVGDYFLVSSGTGLLTSTDTLALWGNGTPKTITLSLRREGWWISEADPLATVNTERDPVADEVLMQVQLERFGDGFLFNKIVPQDELAGMDPFNPQV